MSELNLRRLADATGMKLGSFTEWAAVEAPEGMDPRVWADALGQRATYGNAWPERVLDRCPRYAPELAAAPAPAGRETRTVHDAA